MGCAGSTEADHSIANIAAPVDVTLQAPPATAEEPTTRALTAGAASSASTAATMITVATTNSTTTTTTTATTTYAADGITPLYVTTTTYTIHQLFTTYTTQTVYQSYAVGTSSVPRWKLFAWEDHGGLILEPALTSGAVRLLDARWLVKLAASGGRLEQRQHLPEEAFLSLDDLKNAQPVGVGTGWLPIAAVSYARLQPDHPDPHGFVLRRVALALETLLKERHPVDQAFAVYDPQQRWVDLEEVELELLLLRRDAGLSTPPMESGRGINRRAVE